MERHYFIGSDLAELEQLEDELQTGGIEMPQLHVLSEDESGLQHFHLNEGVSPVAEEVFYGSGTGLLLGGIIALGVVFGADYFGLTESFGWLPALFLAAAVLGFCCWEGGFLGLQGALHERERFADDLHQGKHVLMVDVDVEQEPLMRRVMGNHPGLVGAGTANAPSWVVSAQKFLS